MLTITEPTIKTLLLTQLVKRIDNGGVDDLLRAGFSPDFLDQIRRVPSRDLLGIAAMKTLEICVTFDERSALAMLRRLAARRRAAVLCEYFIVHGAPQQLMADLFKLSASEFRRLREQLLPCELRGGRARLPETSVRDAIHVHWHELSRRDPLPAMRERIYELHQKFPTVDIASLCQTLNEFGDEPWIGTADRKQAACS